MTSINTNISAYYAQNNLRASAASGQSAIAKLSSGNRIVKASDDVAGLSVGTILRTNVNTLKTALTNANQGTTLLQIADGSLARVGEILQRQKALATQTNSGTLSDNEKGYLDQEFQALKTELDRIVDTTNFNGVKLIDGNLASDTATIATEVPASMTAKLTDSTNTLSTSVITGGIAGVTVQTVGTATSGQLALQGSLADATVSAVYSGGTTLGSMTLHINGIDFKTAAFNTFDNTTAANYDFTQVLTATETAAGKTASVIRLAVADLNANLGHAASAAGLRDSAEVIQTELRKATLYQNRALESTIATDASAIDTTKFAGTILAGMSGADVVIRGKDFDSTTAFAPSLTNFVIDSMSSSVASFSVQVNGVTYSTNYTSGFEDGVTSLDADITDDDLGTGGSGVIRMTSANDANSYIDIDIGTNTPGTISLVNQDEADGLAAALNAAFGSGSEGGLDFQVGTDSTDTVSIAIEGVNTSSLYVDNDGASVTMDLVDGDINDMQEALDNAIRTVTSARANVGALQSRFNYAAAAIEVSVQNMDAARSVFMDADISEESTNFAKAQVLQQAAISVLAQANQIPQNLLKLIG